MNKALKNIGLAGIVIGTLVAGTMVIRGIVSDHERKIVFYETSKLCEEANNVMKGEDGVLSRDESQELIDFFGFKDAGFEPREPLKVDNGRYVEIKTSDDDPKFASVYLWQGPFPNGKDNTLSVGIYVGSLGREGIKNYIRHKVGKKK